MLYLLIRLILHREIVLFERSQRFRMGFNFLECLEHRWRYKDLMNGTKVYFGIWKDFKNVRKKKQV